jgi:hypothetical protein
MQWFYHQTTLFTVLNLQYMKICHVSSSYHQITAIVVTCIWHYSVITPWQSCFLHIRMYHIVFIVFQHSHVACCSVVVFFWFFFYRCVCGCMFCKLLFNSVGYAFLLLCMLCSVYSVFIMPIGILRLPRLRFFRAFSSVVRQMPGYTSQRWDTVRTLPN